jgi:hypothetical protein
LKSGNFTVYPNPTRNSITIESVDLDTKSIAITIMNALGQTVKIVNVTENISPDGITVNMENLGLSEGLYIININQNNKISSFKIMYTK